MHRQKKALVFLVVILDEGNEASNWGFSIWIKYFDSFLLSINRIWILWKYFQSSITCSKYFCYITLLTPQQFQNEPAIPMLMSVLTGRPMLLALHYFLPLVWSLLSIGSNFSHQCVLVKLKCPIFLEYSLTIILLNILVITLLTLWCLIQGLVQSSHY